MIKTHCRFYSPVSFRVQPDLCKSANLALAEDGRLVLQRVPILVVASVSSFIKASLLQTSI